MRLQLSSTQISVFAGKVGSLRSIDLKAAIQAVLVQFETDLDPFTRKDLTAVLREAGFPTDLEKDPEAWATVSAEIKRFTKGTSEKGFYTQKGVDLRPPPPSRFAPPEPFSTETSPEQADVEIKELEGVFWSPLLVGSSDEVYNDDLGLRRIAVSQSVCFGNYSSRATQCQGCPLASFCAQASIANLPTLVATLDAATVADIKAAKTVRKPSAPSPIDDLLGISPAPVAVPRPLPDEETLDLSGFPRGTNVIPISFEAVCTGCSKEIFENSKGVHVPEKGLFHIACAKALLMSL